MKYIVKTIDGDLIEIVENDSYTKLLEFLSSEFKALKPVFCKNQAFNFGAYTGIDSSDRQVLITLEG